MPSGQGSPDRTRALHFWPRQVWPLAYHPAQAVVIELTTSSPCSVAPAGPWGRRVAGCLVATGASPWIGRFISGVAVVMPSGLRASAGAYVRQVAPASGIVTTVRIRYVVFIFPT